MKKYLNLLILLGTVFFGTAEAMEGAHETSPSSRKVIPIGQIEANVENADTNLPTVSHRFIEDDKHRRNLAIAAFCNGCIDCASETKHTYCLGFFAPCNNPLKNIIIGVVMVPLCVIGDCFRVGKTPPRRRKDLEDAIHCRSHGNTVFSSVGPECLYLKEHCCSCCVKKENMPFLTQFYRDLKAQDARELKELYQTQNEQLPQQRMR